MCVCVCARVRVCFYVCVCVCTCVCVCQAAENVSCLLFHVMQGEEVCINYLGSNSMAPLSQRQQALQDGYGFSCGCARCRAEGVAELSAARAAAEVRLFWFVTALTELSAAQAAAEVQLRHLWLC